MMSLALGISCVVFVPTTKLDYEKMIAVRKGFLKAALAFPHWSNQCTMMMRQA
jgi:hypothetical protein